MSIVLKCMTIMSIIITEEDLCKKHAKKCAKICQFSSLPSKCFQAANDPNTKNDSKPHICAYNYNTRTGFRDHKKTWGPRVLSSALLQSVDTRSRDAEFQTYEWAVCCAGWAQRAPDCGRCFTAWHCTKCCTVNTTTVCCSQPAAPSQLSPVIKPLEWRVPK